MMQTGREWIVFGGWLARRTKHDAELAIVILDVQVAVILKAVLLETQDWHKPIVKFARASHIADSQINVIYADDFHLHERTF